MYDKPRKMPSRKLLEQHWDLGSNQCYRCREFAPAVDRAHIIDRCYFPSETPVEIVDGPENIVPLCRSCHSRQPSCKPGQEDLAWAYLRMDLEEYVRQFLHQFEEEDSDVLLEFPFDGMRDQPMTLGSFLMVCTEGQLFHLVALICAGKRDEMVWSKWGKAS